MGNLYDHMAAGSPKVKKSDDTDVSILDENVNSTKTTLATGLGKLNDSVTDHVAPSDSKVAITASSQILSGPGILYGFTIVSHTAGATVRFSDALTATTPYVSSVWTSVAGNLAGQNILIGGINGMQMATGCYITITGTIELIPLVKLD